MSEQIYLDNPSILEEMNLVHFAPLTLREIKLLQTYIKLVKEKEKEKEKEIEEKREDDKQSSIKPNLKIMSDWLDNYGELFEKYENERIIREQHSTIENSNTQQKIQRIVKILDTYDKAPRSRKENAFNRDFESIDDVRREHDFLTNELEKEVNITKKYNDLNRITKLSGYRKDMIRELDTIQTGLGFTVGPASYFMKQYIEATHNMFVIQQKRIDELEKLYVR